jgi:hypothetical protein
MENQSRPIKWLLIALFILWLAISAAGYYWVQNALLQPVIQQIGEMELRFPGLSLAAVGRTLLHLLIALWLAFAALGSGRFLLQRLKQTELNPLEQLFLGLGLGFGGLGLVVFLLGIVGLLYPWLFYVLMVGLTLVVARPTYQFLRQLPRPSPGRIVAIFLAASLFLGLSKALLPPADWDGLFYHLTGPKLYLEAGRIVSGIDIPHLSFPASFEMLFMLAMGLVGDVPAVLLHFTFHLMTAGLVYLIARDLLGVKNSWLAVLFFYAMPMVLTLAGWAYNDMGLAFYETAALYCLLKWAKTRFFSYESIEKIDASQKTGFLLFSAIFSGLAMGIKYTSFVGPLALVLLLVWWGRKQVGQVIRPLLLFGIVAFLVAAPWFLKNLAFTGNPVYPFILGGDYWDDFRADAYAESGTGIAYNPATCDTESQEQIFGQHATGCEFDAAYLAGNLVGLPYFLTLGYWNPYLRDANHTDGISGPLFLIFLPLMIAYGLFRAGGTNRVG